MVREHLGLAAQVVLDVSIIANCFGERTMLPAWHLAPRGGRGQGGAWFPPPALAVARRQQHAPACLPARLQASWCVATGAQLGAGAQ